MSEFRTWFCLNGRQNFTIDPQITPEDAQYYFGRPHIKSQLQKQLRRSFVAPGVPKLMVWGPYGSGKTQTLFYLEGYLRAETPEWTKGAQAHTLYLTVEMRSTSTARDLHLQMMEALGKDAVSGWVRSLFNKVDNLDTALQELADDSNIAMALKELRTTGESTFLAWRWLSGQTLRSAELNNLGLTRNLGDVGAGDLVNAVVAVGRLAAEVGERLIFLLDELEELLNVRAGDAAESLHQYFRRLAEPANSSVGFLIGFKADVLDDAPDILVRGDVKGRIGASNYVELQHWPAVSDVQRFVSELFKNLIDQESAQRRIAEQGLSTEIGVYPFERNAFELLADYAAQDTARALPRYIINAINECAIQAWDDEMHLIDEEIVNNVAPLVFQ